jgi:hypothetical protein
VTFRVPSMATLHVLPLVLLHPDQLEKVEPDEAVAVSVTTDPPLKDALQVAPQLIPDGLLVTAPLPATVTLSVCVTTAVKVAVTERAALMLTVHVLPLVLLHPDQLVKVEPDAAVAVSVTDVLLPKVALQVEPQLIPDGLLVTVPVPVPLRVTRSVLPELVKAADTLRAALMDTVQLEPLVESQPVQLLKVEPDDAAAVSVTDVPTV